MKLSIIATVTNPVKRQDPWLEALECYLDLADQVVIVNGGTPFTFENITKIPDPDRDADITFVNLEWPYEWSWEELPRHLNAGLEQATGDWVIKCDIDYFFHEKDHTRIREL